VQGKNDVPVAQQHIYFNILSTVEGIW